jgi:hypothetical protein
MVLGSPATGADVDAIAVCCFVWLACTVTYSIDQVFLTFAKIALQMQHKQSNQTLKYISQYYYVLAVKSGVLHPINHTHNHSTM